MVSAYYDLAYDTVGIVGETSRATYLKMDAMLSMIKGDTSYDSNKFLSYIQEIHANMMAAHEALRTLREEYPNVFDF